MVGLRQLWRHRYLLWLWGQREVKVRYKQSLLGVAWAIMQPLALAGMFSLVFSYIARIPSDGFPYPVFAYSALVPWTFLANAVTLGVPSLVNHMNLVTKAAFPKEILPLGVVIASMVDYFFSFIVFAIMILVYQIPLTISVLWLPILILIQLIIIIGVILWGASLNVLYRDIRFVVPLAVQMWMYATPIVYPISLVPDSLCWLHNMNPMVGVIESYRDIFLKGLAPDWRLLLINAGVALVVMVSGYAYFKRLEPDFADLI